MLGIPDFWVWSGYLLSILSGLLCVVYGAMNWNKGEADDKELKEDKIWGEHEKEVEESL